MRRRVKDAARKKFKLGDRVCTTADYTEWFKYDPRNCTVKHAIAGTVSGFSKDGALVRVRKDGRKSDSGYHPDFWEVVIEWNENFSSASQKTTAIGRTLRAEGKAAVGRIPVTTAHDVRIVPVEQSVKPETHEVSCLTEGPLFAAWQRVSNFAGGINSKLQNGVRSLRIWWSR